MNITEVVRATRNGAGTEPSAWFEPGTVTGIDSGVATVAWRGIELQAAHLDSYTPSIGHTVLLLVQPPQVLIVGRVIGAPN